MIKADAFVSVKVGEYKGKSGFVLSIANPGTVATAAFGEGACFVRLSTGADVWFRQAELHAPPVSPRDGRCKRDETYHDRIRADGTLYDEEIIPIGEQDLGGAVLVLGICPGCGTTISRPTT